MHFVLQYFVIGCILIMLIGTKSDEISDNNNCELPNCLLNKTEAQHIWDEVPENVRDDFIKIHLAVALKLLETSELKRINLPADIDVTDSTYEELINMNVPKSFSKNLLLWTMNEFQLSHTNVKQIIRSSQICFPSGCVDLGDIGSLCCPF